MRRFFLVLAFVLIAVGCARKAPLIGISCARSGNGASLLGTAYSEAISKAGGIPVVIPTISSQADAQAILARLDGIVFSGGEDLNPAWYGETVLNETVQVDSLRDYSDSLLARAALSCGKPILGICRGEQLMNVILGGSLYQDIPSQLPHNSGHGGGARHKIGLEEGSTLAQIFGLDSLEVNSFHHQGVKVPAPGIRITARGDDGFVEAFETRQILAVQFHPEKMLQQGDERWLALFEAFVSRCQ